MNRLQVLIFTLFICYISTDFINGQTKKKIQIEYAGKLTIDEENYPGAKILTRDDAQQVHIEHNGANMWCDKAIHYSAENFIEAYGNVNIKQGDTINMTAKYVEYSGITELAFARGEVVLEDPNSTITSDTLYFDKLKEQAFYKSGGTVVKDSSGTITSKIGRYYMNMKKYQFVDDVVLVNEESTINSDYFDFYSDTGLAYLYGPSTITTETSKTYCEKGFYDTENKVGYALKNAKIDYDNRIIEGDSLYFDDTKSFASASNNIKITDTINNSVVKGHYAEVFKEKDSVFITKRALAITVQENDSIYIHADKIMVTGKPENRIINAYYNAKMYKSDMSGKADSIYSNQKTGMTKFINIPRFSPGDKFSVKRKPVLWNLENQMTGDTIHLISNNETEKIDSLLVFNNAFIISQDTISKTGYNQIYGMRLVGLFNDENKLRQVDINKNAESIFYARNDQQELIGIDKAKSGSISILFSDGDIDEYTRFNQVDGNLYPESKYPENQKFLKGFDWREQERPLSVEDLFKDDKPYNLPIIKGLEDYVPQSAFFDEDMMERIEQAGNYSVFSNGIGENLLKSGNDFNESSWIKINISVKSDDMLVENYSQKADKIYNTNAENGIILQDVTDLKGKIQISIWIKGNGKIVFRLQSKNLNGKGFRDLSHSDITLKNTWTKYTLEGQQEKDNVFRFLLGQIQPSDEVYAWGAELLKLSE
ncbi:OstA-like protein [Flavobacteriaceae bacterium SZ-1-7]|uniref:OstA-like protein n=1 Tax=Tamlana sedimenti TaxID=3134126 RepID=UPI003128A2BB